MLANIFQGIKLGVRSFRMDIRSLAHSKSLQTLGPISSKYVCTGHTVLQFPEAFVNICTPSRLYYICIWITNFNDPGKSHKP